MCVQTMEHREIENENKQQTNITTHKVPAFNILCVTLTPLCFY